ncbi:MAG: hypothetical protein R2880_15130 [Deinococcales bacterium]
MEPIVVIDRDERGLEHKNMLLSAVGYQVMAFRCLDKAQNYIHQQGLALLIMPWQLSQPKLLNFISTFRQDSQLRSKPIIALSLAPCIEIQEELMFLEKVRVLKSPVHSSYFLKVVAEMLAEDYCYTFMPLTSGIAVEAEVNESKGSHYQAPMTQGLTSLK